MRTTNKVFLLGMISVVLAFGFVFASCSQVFKGNDISGKAVTLKLKSKSYEIQYDGKTYSGDATKVSALGIDTYVWTSGGSGGCIVNDKNVTAFSYTDGTVAIVASNLSRSVVANGEISLDDIELIIEE